MKHEVNFDLNSSIDKGATWHFLMWERKARKISIYHKVGLVLFICRHSKNLDVFNNAPLL